MGMEEEREGRRSSRGTKNDKEKWKIYFLCLGVLGKYRKYASRSKKKEG